MKGPSLLVGRRVKLRKTLRTVGGRRFNRGSPMIVVYARRGGYSLRRAGSLHQHTDIIGVRRHDFVLAPKEDA